MTFSDLTFMKTKYRSFKLQRNMKSETQFGKLTVMLSGFMVSRCSYDVLIGFSTPNKRTAGTSNTRPCHSLMLEPSGFMFVTCW